MANISIIIPVYGEVTHTRKVLTDIAVTCVGVDYEVIVVDNKGDYTSPLPSDRIKVLTPESNLGFSGGNNYGVDHSTGKILIFLNNDVLLNEKSWIHRLTKDVNNSTVTGAQLVTGNTQTSYRGTPAVYLNGWCVAMTRDVYKEVGGWEESFGKGFFEDVWMSQRLLGLGKRLVEVKMDIEHLGSKTISKMPVDKMSRGAGLVYQNFMQDIEKGSKLRIVFFYKSVYPFIDEDYEGKGVGGSEASLILLTRELAKLGHIVEVYNSTTVETCQNNVYYYNINGYNPHVYADVFVLFRNPDPSVEVAFAGTKIFWSCDQMTSGDWNEDIFPFVDRTLCISDFHRNYMISHYLVNPDTVLVLPLGVNGADYESKVDKIPGSMIYCSVPNRGLEYVEEIYLAIRKLKPEVTLTVTSDYTLWGTAPGNTVLKRRLEHLPGVKFLGKVSRRELVEEQKKAEYMCYPCNYDENFCISALECLASGAVPITTRFGALPETVGEKCGVMYHKKPSDDGFEVGFAHSVVTLMDNPGYRDMLRLNGYMKANKLYWSNIVKDYGKLFNDLIERNEFSMTKCSICGTEFKSAYHMFLHRSSTHELKPGASLVPTATHVKINTTKPVYISINTWVGEGTELLVPKDLATEAIRILLEGHGRDIIKSAHNMSS